MYKLHCPRNAAGGDLTRRMSARKLQLFHDVLVVALNVDGLVNLADTIGSQCGDYHRGTGTRVGGTQRRAQL